MLFKKVTAILMLVMLTVSFTACSSGKDTNNNDGSDATTATPSGETANSTADDSSSSGEQIEIRFAWWGDTVRNAVYNEICDRFEDENPNIKVVREPGAWADYWNKLATQTGGGNAPDVFGMHPQYASDYATRGALLDLEPYFDNGTIDKSNFTEAVYNSGRCNGLLCMVPQGISFSTWLANTTMAEEYGIQLPANGADWTWDDFAAVAKQFTDKVKAEGGNIYFTSDHSAALQAFRLFARQAGGELYTGDGKLNFDQATVEKWFTYWKDLRDYGALPDGPTTTEDSTKPVEQRNFTLGNALLTNVPANQLHLYQAQMPDSDLECVRIPTGANGERAEYIEGAHFSVYADIDQAHQEAAAKLINFFVNSEKSMELFKMEQGAPANQKMSEFIKPLLDSNMSKEIDYLNFVMQVGKAGIYPPKGATEIDTAFANAGAQVQFGELTPAEAAEEFMKQANDILNSNQ